MPQRFLCLARPPGAKKVQVSRALLLCDVTDKERFKFFIKSRHNDGHRPLETGQILLQLVLLESPFPVSYGSNKA